MGPSRRLPMASQARADPDAHRRGGPSAQAPPRGGRSRRAPINTCGRQRRHPPGDKGPSSPLRAPGGLSPGSPVRACAGAAATVRLRSAVSLAFSPQESFAARPRAPGHSRGGLGPPSSEAHVVPGFSACKGPTPQVPRPPSCPAAPRVCVWGRRSTSLSPFPNVQLQPCCAVLSVRRAARPLRSPWALRLEHHALRVRRTSSSQLSVRPVQRRPPLGSARALNRT